MLRTEWLVPTNKLDFQCPHVEHVPNLALPSYQHQPHLNQLPAPFILVGDFIAHSQLWGNTNLDARGKIVEKIIDQLDLAIFNDKSHTYFHFPTRSTGK